MQSVQLELQGTVELEQALPVGDGPPGKKREPVGYERGPGRAGTEVGFKSLSEAHDTGLESCQVHWVTRRPQTCPVPLWPI